MTLMNAAEYFEQPRINLTGAVNEKMLEDLDRQVKSTNLGPDAQAVVTLTSGGGSVGYARAIYEELSLIQHQTKLTFVARGLCLSAAVTIAMAFPSERRVATPNTKFLIHEGSLDVTPSINGTLSAREIQKANFDTSFNDDQEEGRWVMHLIAKGCKRPIREVRKEARSGLWLIGKGAVDYGLVSSLIYKRRK